MSQNTVTFSTNFFIFALFVCRFDSSSAPSLLFGLDVQRKLLVVKRLRLIILDNILWSRSKWNSLYGSNTANVKTHAAFDRCHVGNCMYTGIGELNKSDVKTQSNSE